MISICLKLRIKHRFSIRTAMRTVEMTPSRVCTFELLNWKFLVERYIAVLSKITIKTNKPMKSSLLETENIDKALIIFCKD